MVGFFDFKKLGVMATTMGLVKAPLVITYVFCNEKALVILLEGCHVALLEVSWDRVCDYGFFFFFKFFQFVLCGMGWLQPVIGLYNMVPSSSI